VKSGGCSDGIIIGRKQLGDRFLQICSQQQRVAGSKDRSDLTEKVQIRRMAEISNGAAQKENQDALAPLPARSHFTKAFQIFTLKTDDTGRFNIGQFTLTQPES